MSIVISIRQIRNTTQVN